MIGKMTRSENKLEILRKFGIDWVKEKIIDIGIDNGLKIFLTQTWVTKRIGIKETLEGLTEPLSVTLNVVFHYSILTKEVPECYPNAKK
jgi:hypothetical protein